MKMINFIICGCKETMPETVLEIIYNRHSNELNMNNISFSYHPISDQNNYIIYIEIKPSDLWEALCDREGKMPESNRQYFNNVVSEFSRYNYQADKTLQLYPQTDIENFSEQIYEIIKEVFSQKVE